MVFGRRRESYSPRCGIPDPDGRVERAGDDAFSVERYGVDLVIMTSEDVQAFARIDVPQLLSALCTLFRWHSDHTPRDQCPTHPTGEVITSRDQLIPGDLYAPDALLVPAQRAQQHARLDIPYTKSMIPRARDGYGPAVEDFDTADGRGMASQYVYVFAAYKLGFRDLDSCEQI